MYRSGHNVGQTWYVVPVCLPFFYINKSKSKKSFLSDHSLPLVGSGMELQLQPELFGGPWSSFSALSFRSKNDLMLFTQNTGLRCKSSGWPLDGAVNTQLTFPQIHRFPDGTFLGGGCSWDNRERRGQNPELQAPENSAKSLHYYPIHFCVVNAESMHYMFTCPKATPHT